MPSTINPRAPSEASTRSRLSLFNARSRSPSKTNSNQSQHQPAPSTASTACNINATFSRSPNATPMPLPRKCQSAIPSLGLARSQFISIVGSGAVGGARKSLPSQTQEARPCRRRLHPPMLSGSPLMSMITLSPGAAAAQNQSQNQTLARPGSKITSLSMTPPRPAPSIASPKIGFTSPSPRKPLVAANGSPVSKLPGTSMPKGTPPRMSNSTSSNTNTTNTTGTGRGVFGGAPSKIKAKATPTTTNTPAKTKTPSKIRATPSKECLPGVPWSQRGLLDEPLTLTVANGMGNGEVAFSTWGETDDGDVD